MTKVTPIELDFIRVTAARLLPDGTPDPCADPQNAGTDYCRTRLPNETPKQWAQRQSTALEVTVRDGNRAPTVLPSLPFGLQWAPLAAAVALVFLATRLK